MPVGLGLRAAAGLRPRLERPSLAGPGLATWQLRIVFLKAVYRLPRWLEGARAVLEPSLPRLVPRARLPIEGATYG